MLSWTKDFLRRHKKKLITLGMVAGGAIASYKVLQWKLSEWREKELEDYKRQAKKQFHFESNQQTCLTTYMQFLIPLRNKICETLNIEEITASLSSKPGNKLELWEHLKVLGFTRTMTSVVSICTLYVFLKVQMNIIAGYMYTETIADSGNAEMEKIKELLHEIEMDQPVSSLQKEYLKNVTFLFEDGIMLLINDIKQLVIDNIGMTSLKNKMTHYELSKIIMNIWEQLKSNSFHQLHQDTMTSCFSKYILDPAECQKKTQYLDEEKYQKVMSETLDVVESDDFQTVLTDCVKESLEHLLQLVEPHFQYQDPEEIRSADDDFGVREQTLPLAKVIPIINGQINQIFKAGTNDYLETLFAVESVGAFAANIYESFSCKND